MLVIKLSNEMKGCSIEAEGSGIEILKESVEVVTALAMMIDKKYDESLGLLFRLLSAKVLAEDDLEKHADVISIDLGELKKQIKDSQEDE